MISNSSARGTYLDPISTAQSNWWGCHGFKDYECVNGGYPPDTSDYLQARYMGDEFCSPYLEAVEFGCHQDQLFVFENLPSTARSVNYITIYYYARWYNESQRTFFPKITVLIAHTSNVTYYGDLINTTSDYQYYTQTYVKNPLTGDYWEVDEINKLWAGMSLFRKEHYSHNGARIAQMDIYVSYNE